VPTKASVGAWGPILVGVASPSDIEKLDDLVKFLRDQMNILSRIADEKWQQWDNATDRKIKRSLWTEYDELWNEYQVNKAWFMAANAARTFAEKGFRSMYLDVQDIPVEDVALTNIDFSR